MTKMAHVVVDDVFVLVHTKDNPDDGEWDAYLDDMKTYEGRFEDIRTYVYTEGGAPNAKQRGELNQMLSGAKTKTAVIAPNAFIRGIVTALNWFNPEIKCFSPSRADHAYRHLGLSDPQIEGLQPAG